ncbi:hypothetical protein CR513_08569, partial [Mucuna pruriens]
MAPDRSRFQNMVKKEQEGFKECAQQWRELAAQVQPLIIEREMVTMFIDTLPSPYYDRVVGNVASNFADLVVVGERIEFTQTNSDTSFAKKSTSEKKKGETNDVLIELIFPQTKTNPSSYPTQGGPRSAVTQLTRPKSRFSFLAVIWGEPTILPMWPHWAVNLYYLPSTRCSLEPDTFGVLQQPTPYIPPNQPRADAGATTNARSTQQAARRSHMVVPLKPLEPPYARSYDPNARCDYHGGAIGHATERCWSLKHKVQNLLDDRLLGFKDKGPNVHSNPLPTHGATTFNTISHMDERVASPSRRKDEESGKAMDSANWVEEGPHPYQSNDVTTVAYIEGNDNPRPKLVPFIIQVLAKPVYNNNVVPWKYPTEEPQAPQIRKETTAPKITNIAEAGGMTWSGRIFALEALRIKDQAPVKKERTVESPKRMVTEEEAREFLKKSHREILLRVLNEAHVPQDITPAKFWCIINNISMSRHLPFSEEEVLVEGKNHNQSLHSAVLTQRHAKTTLDKLCSPGTFLRNNPVVVRAFNGSKREVMGEITLPIRIGPTTFDITFQVMDIRLAYSCLLGRPWIHAVGAVPSSLH